MKKILLFFAPALFLAACAQPFQPDTTAEWSLTLVSRDSALTTLVIPSSQAGDPVLSRKGKRTEVAFTRVGGKDIDVLFSYRGDAASYEVTPTVINREEGWTVLALAGPEERDLRVDVEKMKLLFPEGAGLRFDLSKAEAVRGWKEDTTARCLTYSRPYPSQFMSMQWAAFTGDEGSLYLASHDPEFRWKDFQFKYFQEEKRVAFQIVNHFVCFPGETWAGPPTLVARTADSWKTGAKTYRDWFLSVRPLRAKADWVRKSSGWLLTILRQQNDELMWDYGEVGTTLADAAEKRGIDIVGLFGWTVGGHDRFYPDYDIDPRMGGKETLMQSIRKIHDRGMRAVVYANGQLIDKNGTQYWPDTGRFVTVKYQDGTLSSSRFWKYASAGPRDFGKGCYQAAPWRNRLLRLALQAHEIGADGIIFDQMGVASPTYCFADNHDHPSPAVVYDRDRVEVVEWISAELKKRNPDFLILTEGVQDCEMNGIGMVHGYSVTSNLCPDPAQIRHTLDGDSFLAIFPDMLRYTFPEGDGTIRMPNPASTRASLNFGTAFGYKHEVECRYMPDKHYLVDGKIPAAAEYGDIRYKPALPQIQDQDPAEVIAYSKAVLDFRRKYEDLLYAGHFASDDHFSLASDNPHVLGRAFVSGKQMGVLVWNASDEASAAYTVVPDKGWTFVGAAAPEGTPVEGDLPAQSIRLLVFKQ